MKRLSCILTILSCITLVGCSGKNDLSDIKVNELDSELFTKEEYHQLLDEFVSAFNRYLGEGYGYNIEIEEISYVSDTCLKMEIQDLYENEKSASDKKDEYQIFLLLKLRLDKASIIDKLNVTGSFPDDYRYFVGKKQDGKWEVLRTGLAYPGAYDLQCELTNNQ